MDILRSVHESYGFPIRAPEKSGVETTKMWLLLLGLFFFNKLENKRDALKGSLTLSPQWKSTGDSYITMSKLGAS